MRNFRNEQLGTGRQTAICSDPLVDVEQIRMELKRATPMATRLRTATPPNKRRRELIASGGDRVASPVSLSVSRSQGRRFTALEYARMIDAGVLRDGEPVELLNGLVVQKMAKKPPHRIATLQTREVLRTIVPKGWYVDSQEPIAVPELFAGAGNVPEPDVTVIRGQSKDYRTQHPPADCVGLVVEVSDTTLKQDRGVKRQMYAHAGIPEYWIVNLVDQTLEIHQRPIGLGRKADYEDRRVVTLDGTVMLRLGPKSVGPIAIRALLSAD